jgi:nitrite reductase/ring-hydroxylating ferredoxin subunit
LNFINFLEIPLNTLKNIDDYPSITIEGKKYIKLFRHSELLEKQGRKVTFADDIDMELAIFLVDGKLHCVSNICPHRHARDLHRGFIQNENLVCPLHGWTYNINTGLNVNSKQGRACLTIYSIIERDGYVYVEKPIVKIPKWRALDE